MIKVRSTEEVELMRESGRLVAGALDLAGRLIEPGVTTGRIDGEIEDYIRSNGATPEFKGFSGYPAATCVSVNEQVVHGIPGDRVLVSGDIVGIDVGVRKEGYVGDGARTFAVGDVSEGALKLMRATSLALDAGLAVVSVGVHLSDVSHAIQRVAEDAGFSIVRELAGHGVGTELHEPPEIPNYGPPGRGPVLEEGMTLAIEPMVNAGTAEVKTLEDGWTVVTADGSLSAHFEHSVAVTSNGADVLTVMTG
ncbi:MAG: type I methionyl aminopeptidase [Candidatus Eisenbacteria bacterium]|nr:type I methionyl aminopeptidase [Candidatus Eisenbacteria bacterium]